MSAKTKVKACLLYDEEGDPSCYTLPADAESFDAMVEQIAKQGWGNAWYTTQECIRENDRHFATLKLAAIGITRTSRSSRPGRQAGRKGTS